MARIEIDPDHELAELQEYLGPDYDHRALEQWQQAVDDELARLGDEQTLYRQSHMYLYNLTAFAMSRTKEPYLADLTAEVAAPARVLDYGCGIGSDGLALLEAGYEVGFADFANPSTEYLRWRLQKRRLQAPVYDLDDQPPPPGWDAAFAFDVIEHVDDAPGFLTKLEQLAKLVVVNFLEPLPQEVAAHQHDLPVDDLLAYTATRKLRRYRLYHGRSHVVAYEGVGGVAPIGRARIAFGRALAKMKAR